MQKSFKLSDLNFPQKYKDLFYLQGFSQIISFKLLTKFRFLDKRKK